MPLFGRDRTLAIRGSRPGNRSLLLGTESTATYSLDFPHYPSGAILSASPTGCYASSPLLPARKSMDFGPTKQNPSLCIA